MKVDINTLQDTFKFSYEAFMDSREEGDRVMNYYHNRQFTDAEVATLQDRGAPIETFNVIKTFGRLLLGYYSTVVNAVRVKPVQENDVATAQVLNDIVGYIMRDNHFGAESEKIKLDLMIYGMMASYTSVDELKETDQFGRPKYRVSVSHCPVSELVIDPMSKLEDYSDARFIHRFKWVTKENLVNAFKHKSGALAKIRKLEPYTDFLNQSGTQFEAYYGKRFEGSSDKSYDVYLLVHSVMLDDNGDAWEVYWSQDTIISKDKITYREVKFPYRLHKLSTNNNVNEYYGIFREVLESQRAINQAITKIQLLLNTNQIYVEDGAVEDEQALIRAVSRVNSLIKVKDLQGVRVEKLSVLAADQYVIIDKALDRIQRVLSINDSFLGMAFASDSGAKVQIQQKSTISALRYLTLAIEQFYQLLGQDLINLIKQYYTAEDVFRVADQGNAERWVRINEPLQYQQGVDANGQPILQYMYEEYRDPASGEFKADKDGKIMLVPMPTAETDIQFTAADIEVESIAFNDEIERNRLMLEQFMSGPLGQMLSTINPVGFFKAGALAIKEVKGKYSDDLAQILEETAGMLTNGANPNGMAQMQQGAAAGQEKPKSTANNTTGM